MKKYVFCAIGMLIAVLSVNGCSSGAQNVKSTEVKESAVSESDFEEQSMNETGMLSENAETGAAAERSESTADSLESVPEGTENTAESLDHAGSPIAPAATRQEALDLHDEAFTQHDFAYLLAACIEPYGREYVDFLLANGLLSETEYWSAYDDSQGSYYDIGVFEGYSSEIIDERPLDSKTIEEELLRDYDYSCTVQEAYEVTYNQTAAGTGGTAVNEGYRVQMVLVNGSWYISKML